jgi:ABC-type molybdenum transport system ATPase subunit/photorepair protein PhrA
VRYLTERPFLTLGVSGANLHSPTPPLAVNFLAGLRWKSHCSASCSFKMISFSNINKQYGKQLLFVDAPLQLNPGEKVGLVGPNGAGKTTLFRMVVGEELPTRARSQSPGSLTLH